MGGWLKQSTAVTVKLGPFVDETDGVTEQTALSPVSELSKNGGAFATGPTGTHDSEGWYGFALTTAHTDTLGILQIKAQDAANHAPVWDVFMVLTANAYDSLVAGTDTLQADVAQWLGTAAATPSVGGVPEVDVTHWIGAAVTAGVGSRPAVDAEGISGSTAAADSVEANIGNLDAAVSSRATPTQVGTEIDNRNLCRAMFSGSADSGSTTQIVDSNLIQPDTDHWVGAWVVMTSGDLAGQARKIENFVPASDSIFVDRPFTQTVSVGDDYEIWPADFPNNFSNMNISSAGNTDGNLVLWRGTSPNLLISGRVDTLVGVMATGVVTAIAIANDAITAAKIADGAIDAATFAAGAIDAAAIASGAIDADAITSDAASKIADAFAPQLQNTTIATLASQTSFTLTAGSADDDAYNGSIIIITDAATSTQKAVGRVSDYVGSTKTITLAADPGIFVMAVGDTVDIIAVPKQLDASVSSRATPTEVNSEVDTALTDIGLDHLLSAAVAGTDVTDDSVVARLAAKGAPADFDTFDQTTDSLEAIRDRGDAAWTSGGGGSSPSLLQNTTIATLASQTSFTLTAGSADDDAYNGSIIVITDSATSTQKAVGLVSDYVGLTRTVTLAEDPGIFVMAVGDTVDIIAVPKQLPDVQHDAAGGLPTGDASGRVDVGEWLGAAVTAGVGGRPATDAEAISGATAAADSVEANIGNLDATVSSRATPTQVGTEIDNRNLQRALASGTADSGTTTTLVDAARTEADTDYWKGAWLIITSGTIAGQARKISAFTPASDTITVDRAFTQAVGTNTYEIWQADLPDNFSSFQVETDGMGHADVKEWLGAAVTAGVGGRPAVDSEGVSGSTVAADNVEANIGNLDATVSSRATSGSVAAVQSDTDDIQTRLPAALVGGRMDSDVGVIQTGAVNASAVASDAASKIAAAVGPQQNVAFSNLTFLMVDATDGFTPETGLTVTGQRSLDGAAFAAVAGTIAEVGNGIYQFDAAAADMNAGVVTFKFSAAGARDRFVTIKTTSP